MKTNTQSGFSLIELLLVVAIIGIIAVIGIPSFQRGIRAADSGTVYATMRSMASTQIGFFSQNNRFARLDELNALHGNGLGTPIGTGLLRGRYFIEMSPPTPTDAELQIGYTILATESVGVIGTPYQFSLSQSGEIVQVTP